MKWGFEMDLNTKDIRVIIGYLKKKFDNEWHSGDDSATHKILAMIEFERAVDDYTFGKELAKSV